VVAGKGGSLHDSSAWLNGGFPLGEDLPLIDTEFLPPGRLAADA
jgi:serine/threonine-protein kinase HipA